MPAPRRFLRLIGCVPGLALLLLVPTATSDGATQPAEMIVGRVQGRWYVGTDSRQRLVTGQSIPADAELRIETPASTDYIKLCYQGYCSRKNTVIYECARTGLCDRPLRPKWPEPSYLDTVTGVLKERASDLWGRLWSKPELGSLESRGGGLSDAVAKLEGRRLDLSPVFREMEKNLYYVLLEPAEVRRKRVGPFAVRWDPAREEPAEAEGLTPGLYELTLLRQTGERLQRTGETALVLISGPADFAALAREYQQAKEMTAAWKEEVGPGTVRGLLRAQLDLLAERTAAK